MIFTGFRKGKNPLWEVTDGYQVLDFALFSIFHQISAGEKAFNRISNLISKKKKNLR